MNKKIHIFSFILIWFILNIIFFMFSDNYRYFLQSLKYDKDVKYKINDEFKISIEDTYKDINTDNKQNDLFTWLSNNFVKKTTKKHIKKDLIENKSNAPWKWKKEIINKKSEFIDSYEKIKLTNIEKQILKSFEKHNLKEIDLHPRLFDLTWEYPNEYFEYYGKDINLYFFWNKLYSDIKDIFEVLTYELPFSINEIDNFWKKSFYINLNSWFLDDYVRVILKKSNRIIWFKIKKELYEKMKDDLAVIFHK